jgi:hypothetical protein
MIREVLSKQPKMLSNSTYNLDIMTILDHESIDSLVRDL